MTNQESIKLQSQLELVELAYVAMVVRDMENRIIFWNPRAVQVYGWSREEALGQITHELWQTRFPTSREQVDAELQTAGHWEGELQHMRRDGTVITVLSRQAIQHDAQGRPVAILEVNLDITEQRRAQKALQDSENRFRTSIENMLDAFAIFAAVRAESGQIVDFNWEFINEAGCRVTMRSKEELIGARLLQVLPAHRESGLYDKYIQVVETGEPFYEESLYYEDVFDGKRLRRAFDIQATRLGDGFAVAWRDVTPRKQAEESLHEATRAVRVLNAELERRVEERTAQLEDAVRELEAFSYSVSHDLRAPLRAIDGFSRILSEEYAAQLEPQALDYLQRVRNSTVQMGQLIDDLLAFSQLNRHELVKQKVQPGELARAALDSLKPETAGRQVEVIIEDLPACEADPVLLKQVFVNLIGNAIKYTRHREHADITIGYQRTDTEVEYFVRDNGAGFDMKYSDKLFRVFQRLHSAETYEGSGVGLAIVQRIVQRHGGRVRAEGVVDEGATFYFTLGSCDSDA